jgi:transcriptional regulator
MPLYLPRHFEQQDPQALQALMHDHPLATWVCVAEGEPVINHLPLHLDPTRGQHGTLIGHVARANPVWQLRPTSSVVIFHGPQAYVTPSWYPTKQASGKVVPTWNYAVVHAHGLPRFIEDRDQLHALVSRLTDRHEAGRAHPWSVNDAPPDYTQTMLGAIVGLEIEITNIQGKFKLSQNRLPVDQRGVLEGAAQGAEAERLMAQAMVKALPGLGGV